MPKIVVTAAVKDVEAWLKFKPEDDRPVVRVASGRPSTSPWTGAIRRPAPGTFPTWDAFQAPKAAPRPKMAAAMARLGMLPPVTIYVKK